MASPGEPPALDTHAHIATDVTPAQVRRLGGAVVFAVTRSLSEAAAVPHGSYPNIVWGLGVHPADTSALDRYDGERFSRLLTRFALVGEVGLDRRAGRLDRQREVFIDILTRAADALVMMSIHSSGLATEVVNHIERHRPRAPILHWFAGDQGDVVRATSAGAWFSVNAAMKADVLARLPPDRVLTETDFPFTRRHGAARPGATEPAEARLAEVWRCQESDVRRAIWRNLGAALKAGGVEALPSGAAGWVP